MPGVLTAVKEKIWHIRIVLISFVKEKEPASVEMSDEIAVIVS